MSLKPGISKTKIQLVAICGSLRRKSHTRQALQIVLEGARSASGLAKLIDLKDYALEFCNPDSRESYPPDVQRLQREVSAAHAIVLGTPEYHGSFSGVLKNALDLMGFEQFEGKMVGLVGVSGGRMGAYDALNVLRNIGRSLHAWVLPEQVAIAQAGKQFDTSGRLRDEETDKRLRELGRQLVRYAYLHNSKQIETFMRAWEEAPGNPGG